MIFYHGDVIKMARLSKKMLKSLVKECLVEILAEGIGTSKVKKSHLRERKQLELEKMHAQHSKALDNVKFKKNIDNTVNALTEDPVLASIFADTAMGTLQEQVQAESIPGMPVDESFSQGSPGSSLESFSDASRNWAALAFSDKKLP